MLAKRFFHVCAGILSLALAYHFGAVSATAQAPGNAAVALGIVPVSGSAAYGALTANGDVYANVSGAGQWTYQGNIFSGSPTPATHETWGGVKARYRQPAQPRDK